MTVQHLNPYGSLDPVPQCDVQSNLSGPLAPSSLLLDYVYGVAVFKLWAANDIQKILRERHEMKFISIPSRQERPHPLKTKLMMAQITMPILITYPLVLDMAAGCTTHLESQNYLTLWTMPSNFQRLPC